MKPIVILGIDGEDECDWLHVHRILKRYRQEVRNLGQQAAEGKVYGRHNLVAVRETLDEISVRFLRNQ